MSDTNGHARIDTLMGVIETNPETRREVPHPTAANARRVSFSDWWHGKTIDEMVARLELELLVMADKLAAEQAVNEFQGIAIEQMRAIIRAHTAIAESHAKAMEAAK